MRRLTCEAHKIESDIEKYAGIAIATSCICIISQKKFSVCYY